MAYTAVLPFFLRRSNDVVGVMEITSTQERVHGLLRLEEDRLVIQWRVARETERVGMEIRTDHDVEAVRELIVPLSAIGGAEVRARGWRRLLGPQVVLTASDLRAFEEITGAAGLKLAHPAALALRILRSDHLLAQEFAGELNLAVAEHALRQVEEPDYLPPPAPGKLEGPKDPD